MPMPAYLQAVFAFALRAVYIRSEENRLPDLLSRWDQGGWYRQEFDRLTHDLGMVRNFPSMKQVINLDFW